MVGGLARGPGKYVYSAATYPQSTNFLLAVEQFVGSTACDEWIHRALNPDTAKQFELLAIHLPQNRFSSSRFFDNWLKENEHEASEKAESRQ